jgi:hypothetical protein
LFPFSSKEKRKTTGLTPIFLDGQGVRVSPKIRFPSPLHRAKLQLSPANFSKRVRESWEKEDGTLRS